MNDPITKLNLLERIRLVAQARPDDLIAFLDYEINQANKDLDQMGEDMARIDTIESFKRGYIEGAIDTFNKSQKI